MALSSTGSGVCTGERSFAHRGLNVVNVPLGKAFPFGLFVAQNGAAPEPASTEPINGYEYDNSTQFKLVDWKDIASRLDLAIEPSGYDPRAP